MKSVGYSLSLKIIPYRMSLFMQEEPITPEESSEKACAAVI